MFPILHDGDIVLVLKRKKQVFRAGDLIVFHHPYEAHRILVKRMTKMVGQKIWVESRFPGTGADSHTFGALKRSLIIGKVICVIRKNSPFLLFPHTSFKTPGARDM